MFSNPLRENRYGLFQMAGLTAAAVVCECSRALAQLPAALVPRRPKSVESTMLEIGADILRIDGPISAINLERVSFCAYDKACTLQDYTVATGHEASGTGKKGIAMNQISVEMKSCIENCLACYSECLSMAMGHCLEIGGKHVEAAHFRLMMACAEICRTSAHFMLIGTEHHKHTCRECAEICRQCAVDCERIGDMESCVETCRRCAESCERMAA